MATIHTDTMAGMLARVRESSGNLADQQIWATDEERDAFRQGMNATWHMVTYGVAASMVADHPRWDRDRFYDLADGVDHAQQPDQSDRQGREDYGH